jgi:autotransporter-associated beta strand protein
MYRPADFAAAVDTLTWQPKAVRRRFGVLRHGVLICTTSIIAWLQHADAATKIWDGGQGMTFNWSNGLNWDANTAPVLFDSLVFDGLAGLTNSNDFIADDSFFSAITFNSTAGAFVLGGNAITLTGNLTNNNATAIQTMNFDVALQSIPIVKVVGGGNLVIGGVLSGFSGLTKTGAGSLTLSNANNSLTGSVTVNGGTLSLATTGTLGATTTLALGNGEFRIAGSNTGPRTQTFSTILNTAGRGTITLLADPAQSTTLTAEFPGSRSIYTTALYRGTNLGGTPGNGVATLVYTTAPPVMTDTAAANTLAALGSGTLGTTQAAVLRGALADNSDTGNGAGFATYDQIKGVRLLDVATEQLAVATGAAYSGAITGENVRISNTSLTITGRQTNTLQLDNTSGGLITVTNSGSALNPSNGLLFSGTSPITLTGGTLTLIVGPAIADMVVLSTNTAGVTISTALTTALASGTTSAQRGYVFGGPGNITVNANVAAANTGAIAINGPGTVTLNASTNPSSQGFVVNGGQLKFGGTFAMASSRPLKVANGAMIDMNGISLSSTAPANGADTLEDITGTGGTITNTSGTASTLTLSSNSTASGTRTFSGTITGNINFLRQTVASTLNQILSGENTYTGTTTINSGSLQLGITNALPTGTALSVNGISTIGSTTVTIPATLNLGGFNQTVASLSGTITGNAATITNNGISPSTLTVNGGAATTFAGNITDGVSAITLIRAGTGSLTLTGDNLYTGGTSILAGTLKVNNTAGSATGSGPVQVSAGATFGGSGTVTGSVTLESAAHIAPGSSIGLLTVGDLTLTAGSILDFEFSLSGNDQIKVNNSLGLVINGGGINLFQENSQTPFDSLGTYSLFQYSDGVSGTGISALSIITPQPQRSYTFGTSGNFVTLTIAATGTVATWNVNGGGSWGDGTKWNTNPTIPNSTGATAILGATITSGATVTLDGNRTIGALTFSNANSYNLAPGTGGMLVMDNGVGNASITTTVGSHTIAAPVRLTSANTIVTVNNASDTLTVSGAIDGNGALIKGGSGILALSANNVYSGGTTVSNGVLQISSDANLGAGTGAVILNGGTLSVLNSIVTARSFQVSGTSGAIQVADGATYQINSSIIDGASAGALNKTGAGTLILNGANSYTDSTIVQSGTIQVGTGGTTGSLGTGPVVNNGAILINRSDTATIQGALSGAGTLTQTGGTLRLAGSNGSYTGDVFVTSGTLNLAHASGIGVGNLSLTNSILTESTSATLSNGADSSSTSFSNLTLSGDITINTGGTNSMTIVQQLFGPIDTTITRNAGTGNLHFGIAGNTSFSNANFLGSFSNTSGTVSFSRGAGSANARWSFTGDTVMLTGVNGTINFGSLSGSSNIAASGTARVAVGQFNESTTYTGVIGSNGGSTMALRKLGVGTLTLTGQNAYASGQAITALIGYNTVISAGTIMLGSSNIGITSGPLGPSSGVVLLGNNDLLTNASLLTGGEFTLANPITVSGGTAASSGYTLTMGGATDNTSTFAGAVTLQNDLTISQVQTTAGHALNLTGAISGTAAGTGMNNNGTPVTSLNNTGTQTVTFAGPGLMNVSGAISNSDGIVAVNINGGTTLFAAANTYTGATNVNAGTLLINGSIGGSATTVNNGGMLGGNGSLGAVNVASGGSIAPGNSTAILNSGNFDLQVGGRLSIELGGLNAGVDYDRLNVLGGVSLAGDLEVSLINSFSFAMGDLFFVVVNDDIDPVVGSFANVSSRISVGGVEFDVFYSGNSTSNQTFGGNDVVLQVVPEPAGALIIASGLGMLLGLRRFRTECQRLSAH